MPEKIRIGFVPSYRNRWTAWTGKMREMSLAALSTVQGAAIVAPGPDLVPNGSVHTLDEAETVSSYFSCGGVAGLILCPLDFGDERSAAKVAEILRVPVLLYATKEPPAREDAGMARVSDSYCGNLSMASALYRREIPFRYAGLFSPDEPEFLEEVETFIRAVSVVNGLQGARIGQVGVRPPTFETVGYDEAAMIKKFGQNVVYANLSDITDRAKELADDDSAVGAVITDITGTVPNITIAPDYLLSAAKMELALAEFWEQNRLSAMAVQCWPSIQRSMGISLCAVYGRMTQRHMLTACETDILGALSMLAGYRAGLGAALPHFVDWTIRHREDPNMLLAWHCGNAPVSLAADHCAVSLRSRNDMKGENEPAFGDPMAGLYQFQVKPGEVTFCRLAEYGGRWKMLIARGEIVPSDEVLAGTWSWVRVNDHERLYRTLVENGFIHHASMCHGNHSRALIEACRFLDIEAVTVE